MGSHVQTHGSCHLELLAVDLGCAADRRGAGIGISLRHALIGGIGSCTTSLTLGILTAQNVHRQRHIAVGLSAAGVLMLIQGIVYLLGILICRSVGLLLSGLIEILAGQQPIRGVLRRCSAAAESVQVTVNVRAHGSGKGLRVVTILGNRRDPGRAGSGDIALHQSLHVGFHHIHGDGSAHGSLLSGGKGAGLGQGSAGLGGRHVESHLLRLVHRMGRRIVFYGLHIIAASDGHVGIFADVGPNGVLRHSDSGCRIQRDVLLGLGCSGTGLTILIGNSIACVQRIGTCHAGGGDPVVSIRPDIQRFGSHAAVIADTRGNGHIGIGHGKARAHADRLTGGIGGCILCCRTGCKGRADLRVGLRHIEQVGNAAVRIHDGIIRNGDGLLLLSSVHFIVEVQGFQLIAGGGLHDDRDPILVLRENLGGSLIRAPETGHIHQLDRAGEGTGIVSAGNVVLIDVCIGLVLRIVARGTCGLGSALAIGLCSGGSAGDGLVTDTHFQRGDEIHGEDSVGAFLQFHLGAIVKLDEVCGLSVCRHGSGREGEGNGLSAALFQIDGGGGLAAAGQIQSIGANRAANLMQLRGGNGDGVLLGGSVIGGGGHRRTDGCTALAFPNHVQQIAADAVLRQEAHRVLQLGAGLHFLGCAAHCEGGIHHAVCIGGNGNVRNGEGVAGQRNGEGLTLGTIGLHIGIGYPLDLHTRVGRQGHGIAGNGRASASPHGDLRIFAGDGCGRRVGIAGNGIVAAAVQVAVSLAAAVFRSGSNGDFIMVAVGGNGQAVADGNRIGCRLGSVHCRNGGIGLAVDDSNSHAACHTDAGGAGAGNGAGAEGMGIRLFLDFQFRVQRARDLVDGGVGQRLARVADGGGQVGLDGLGGVAPQEGSQGIDVHQTFGQHVNGIVDEIVTGCLQRFLNLCRSASRAQQLHAFGQHGIRNGVDLCYGVCLNLVKRFLHDFFQSSHETRFDCVQFQTTGR